jgi:hypothetical protein
MAVRTGGPANTKVLPHPGPADRRSLPGRFAGQRRPPTRTSPSGPAVPNTRTPGSQGLPGNAYVLREPVSDRFPQ